MAALYLLRLHHSGWWDVLPCLGVHPTRGDRRGYTQGGPVYSVRILLSRLLQLLREYLSSIYNAKNVVRTASASQVRFPTL